MRGILFDLDGTLLDIDLGDFLERYFAALGPVVSEVTGLDIPVALDAVMRATEASCSAHPGVTNATVWADAFADIVGAPLTDAAWDRIDRFYAEDFPSLQSAIGPRPGAREALLSARATGARVAIATNPIFPRAAILERMRWAGIDSDEVDVITTYEVMMACKPLPGYFTQTAEMLGVGTAECIMIGDDPVLDMAAADVGMRTYYVGRTPGPPADYAGDLFELAKLLPRLGD